MGNNPKSVKDFVESKISKNVIPTCPNSKLENHFCPHKGTIEATKNMCLYVDCPGWGIEDKRKVVNS